MLRYTSPSAGASVRVVGVIEGVAEASALLVKVFSGTLSDRLRQRKWITAAGYGMAALSKPLFAMATGAGLVFAARFLDRIGKGIRGAPRDALIADLTPKEIRGAAFGLRQSLDTIGAVAGPLLAMALMLAWNDDFRKVFWVAVVPAMLSFALIVFAVKEPKLPSPRPSASNPAPEGPRGEGERPKISLNRKTMRALGGTFWGVAIAGAVLTLARFSEAFLILRSENLGLAVALAPLVLVGMNCLRRDRLSGGPPSPIASRRGSFWCPHRRAGRGDVVLRSRLGAGRPRCGGACSGACTWASRRHPRGEASRHASPASCAARRSACSISWRHRECWWGDERVAGALWQPSVPPHRSGRGAALAAARSRVFTRAIRHGIRLLCPLFLWSPPIVDSNRRAFVAGLAFAFWRLRAVVQMDGFHRKLHIRDRPPDDTKTQQIKIDIRSQRGAGQVTAGRSIACAEQTPVSAGAPSIHVYSASWCVHCSGARILFRRNGIRFNEVDIEGFGRPTRRNSRSWVR